MRTLNRIAARVLDKLIALVPERRAASSGDLVEDAPLVWRYTIADYVDGAPYLTRVLFPKIPLLGIRPMLHKFHRPDGDRSLHNHPWRWAFSLLLAGEYVEERLLPDESQLAGGPISEKRLVRWFNVLTDQDYHRITELRGSVYTLFVAGPRTQSWGFLDERGELVPWRRYIDERRLEIARGAALDAVANALGVERGQPREILRLAGIQCDQPCCEPESDADLRERVLAVLRGSVQ